MKILPLSAGAIWLLLAAPAFAQDAGDCDMLCRLKGYLSTDHMEGDTTGGAPADAPAKARHARSASVHKPAAAPKPVAAVAPPTAVAHEAASESRTAAKRPAPANGAGMVMHTAPVRADIAVPRVVAPAPAKPVAIGHSVSKPTVEPVAVAAKGPAAGAEAATPRRSVQARTARAAGITRTASLSTAIPGSAPAMQAGFH